MRFGLRKECVATLLDGLVSLSNFKGYGGTVLGTFSAFGTAFRRSSLPNKLRLWVCFIADGHLLGRALVSVAEVGFVLCVFVGLISYGGRSDPMLRREPHMRLERTCKSRRTIKSTVIPGLFFW